MPFSPSFSEPWYGGGLGVESALPTETGGETSTVPNTITLDGYIFPVEMKEWRSGPQDTFRDNVAAADETNDTLFNARGAWNRYRFGWHLGAGQELGDLDSDAQSFRFDTSYGIDWAEKFQLQLTPGTTLGQADAGAGLLLCRSGIYVFFASGTELYRTDDLTTWTHLTDPGGTIQAMTTDGTDLYVATSTAMVKYVGSGTAGTAFTTPVAGNCTNVAFCSNRLLMAKANVLYEVAADGTLTTITTHFQAAFRWTSIFNIGSRLYAGGFAGMRSELYTLSTDSSGLLIRSQEAAPFPAGEMLRTVVSSSGVAIICTNKGVRVADVSGDGTLTYGPLIADAGDVKCATFDGRFAYIGWSVQDNGRCGLGKLALDTELSALQPAYGTDVAQAATAAAVNSVAVLDGRIAFTVEGSGVWVTTAGTYATTGVLESGRLTFGSVEPKALIGMEVSFAALETGQSILVSVFDENGFNIGSTSTSTVGATSLDLDLGGEQVRWATVRITLGGPGTSTPRLNHWRLRGYPVPPFVLQWVLPLKVYETVLVNIGSGQQMAMDVDATHTWIEELCGERRYTLFRHGTREYRVRVENFEWRPMKWDSEGADPVGLLVVQLVDA